MTDINPEIEQSLALISQIKLLPELEFLFPHTMEETLLIENSILQSGYDENKKMLLGVLPDGTIILLDGYTRFHILKAHGLLFRDEFFTIPVRVENLLHAKQIAFGEQLIRRNLSPISLVFSMLDSFYHELKESENKNTLSTSVLNNGFRLDEWIYNYIGKQLGLTYISHLIKIWKSNSRFLRFVLENNVWNVNKAYNELRTYPSEYDKLREEEISKTWDMFPDWDTSQEFWMIDGEPIDISSLTIKEIKDFRQELHKHDSPQKSQIPLLNNKIISFEQAQQIAEMFGIKIGLDKTSSFKVKLVQLVEDN